MALLELKSAGSFFFIFAFKIVAVVIKVVIVSVSTVFFFFLPSLGLRLRLRSLWFNWLSGFKLLMLKLLSFDIFLSNLLIFSW